jgi:hypothetical protein
MQQHGRILHSDWDLYDTRHAVFEPKHLAPAQLEAGYWQAYRDFYRWGSIVRGAGAKHAWSSRVRHLAYAAGWKKFEPLWDSIIRLRRVTTMLPLLETILSEFGNRQAVTFRRYNGPATNVRRELDWHVEDNSGRRRAVH